MPREDELELTRRALDALDVAVLVMSSDLQTCLYSNAAAGSLIVDGVTSELVDAIDSYVLERAAVRRLPPATRVVAGNRAYYLRVVPSAERPPVEIVFLRPEVLRDVDVLRLLEQRYNVTRREYQVVSAMRMGKTNRQIAVELGLAEGTVARHVHRLLERLGVRNRTELVHLVDELVKHKG